MRGWIPPATMALLALALACNQDKPERISDVKMGITATFPGHPRMYQFTEKSPFGYTEWFDYTFNPGGRLDERFSVAVANVPEGKQGGTTIPEVIDTFEKDLQWRLKGILRIPLPEGKGPGFRYTAKAPMGTHIEGILVLRRSRFHHAQVTVAKAQDPRIEAFLGSFEVVK